MPQYSAEGKLFSPVPHELPDGRASTLFDEFMIAMSGVPSRMREGMLVLSGDVLLLPTYELCRNLSKAFYGFHPEVMLYFFHRIPLQNRRKHEETKNITGPDDQG